MGQKTFCLQLFPRSCPVSSVLLHLLVTDESHQQIADSTLPQQRLLEPCSLPYSNQCVGGFQYLGMFYNSVTCFSSVPSLLFEWAALFAAIEGKHLFECRLMVMVVSFKNRIKPYHR